MGLFTGTSFIGLVEIVFWLLRILFLWFRPRSRADIIGSRN